MANNLQKEYLRSTILIMKQPLSTPETLRKREFPGRENAWIAIHILNSEGQPVHIYHLP